LFLPFQNPRIEFLQLIVHAQILLLEVAKALHHVLRAECVVVHLIADEGNLIAELLLLDQSRLLVFGDLLVDRIKEAHAFFFILLEEDYLDIVDPSLMILHQSLKLSDHGFVFGLRLEAGLQ